MAASTPAASQGGRRRKTHNKSRNGCAQCKRRHYKVGFPRVSLMTSLQSLAIRSVSLPQTPRLIRLPVRRDLSNMLQLQTPRNKLQLEHTQLSYRLGHCRKAAQHRGPTITKRLAHGQERREVLGSCRRGIIPRTTGPRDRTRIQASLWQAKYPSIHL
jgi:hypothetical protein